MTTMSLLKVYLHLIFFFVCVLYPPSLSFLSFSSNFRKVMVVISKDIITHC